jgi:saccharopine dehydrogenase-like NADP-dependent oxidoreductase
MPSQTKKILIIGAAGAAGQCICREVIRLFKASSLIVGDYKRKRGSQLAKSLGKNVQYRYVDVHDHESISEALEAIDAVILAIPLKEPIVQSMCISRHIPCFDITANPESIAKVKSLNPEAISKETVLIVMAGLFPGLSGMLVKYTIEKTLTSICSIDVSFLPSKNASVGATGIAELIDDLIRPVVYKKDRKENYVPNTSVERTFTYPEPFGEKSHILINHIEASEIAEKFQVHDINYWLGSDKPGAGFHLLIGALKKLFKIPSIRRKLSKIFNSLQRLKVKKTEPETIAMSVEISGNQNGKQVTTNMSLVAPSDYGTTAMFVVAVTKLILSQPGNIHGVFCPFEIFPLTTILDTMDCADVKVYS